jgi:hypothetical protein
MSTLASAPATGAQVKYTYTNKHNVRTQQIELQDGAARTDGANEEGLFNVQDLTIQKINPSDAKSGLSYLKLLVHTASIDLYEANTDTVSQSQDVTENLQRGPFYFSTSSAGEVVDVWFSSDETAKLVFLKTAIAKAFHHTG